KLPVNIEMAAMIQISPAHRGSYDGKPEKRMRSSTAKAAAFGAVDIKPTTGAGAPWYTSGVHTWKGAAETLNPRPIMIIASERTASVGVAVLTRPCAMASIRVEPVAPKASA